MKSDFRAWLETAVAHGQIEIDPDAGLFSDQFRASPEVMEAAWKWLADMADKAEDVADFIFDSVMQEGDPGQAKLLFRALNAGNAFTQANMLQAIRHEAVNYLVKIYHIEDLILRELESRGADRSSWPDEAA